MILSHVDLIEKLLAGEPLLCDRARLSAALTERCTRLQWLASPLRSWRREI